jgi:transposase
VQKVSRVLVLTRVLAGTVSISDAALVLGLSERSIRRLSARLGAEGPEALVHGNHGRQPAHTLDPTIRKRIVELARTTYDGCNDSHLAELLAEREGIAVSRRSIQRILRASGRPSPRTHRPPRYRARRDRRPAAGMLIQLDGSREDWFGTGERCTLVGAIDDATGAVVGACFRAQEDAAGYFDVLGQVLIQHGVPLAVYSDRHGIFVRSPRERATVAEELAGEQQPTQFGRALAELEVELILANSPQAKGRIERLWGTLQDRLARELHLARIRSLSAGNDFLPTYLPRHNARFAVAPADPVTAWRPLPAGTTRESVCCFKYSRMVAADNTVRIDGQVIQLPPLGVRGSYARQRVEVRQHLDGACSVHAPGGRELARSAVPATPPTLRAQPYARAPISGVQPLPRPGLSSPWRKGTQDWHPAAAKRAMMASRGRPA